MSWIQTAKAGDRVVCIYDADWAGGYGDEEKPVAGMVYSIRRIRVFDDGFACVTLNEIENPTRDYADGEHEFMFLASRFRPVDPRKTNIAIFTDMLKTADKPLEVV